MHWSAVNPGSSACSMLRCQTAALTKTDFIVMSVDKRWGRLPYSLSTICKCLCYKQVYTIHSSAYQLGVNIHKKVVEWLSSFDKNRKNDSVE